VDNFNKILKESDFDWIEDIQPIDYGWGHTSFKDAIISQLGNYSDINVGDVVGYKGDNFSVYAISYIFGREIIKLINDKTDEKFNVIIADPTPDFKTIDGYPMGLDDDPLREEFDPFGHIDGPESDDPEELDIDLEQDCILGFSNGNAKLEWPYFSLPAGYSCPFATVCKNFPAKWEGPIRGGKFKKPSTWEKNVKPGPETKFMCYAARAQGQYPPTNVQVFKNINLLNKMKTKEKMANLIIKSMSHHGIDNTDIFRIHEAGDFFSQEYFDAWIEVAKKMPQTLFYAYTTSLPFWINRRNVVPKNFKLIASMDENNEQTILDNNLRYSRVVNDENEAKELGLPIDVDDMVAWGTEDNFALPLHGPQPKGSEAAQTLKRNKQSGLYDKIKQAKQLNKAKKDTLRGTIKKQLRGESFINEDDWDWAESISNPLEISTTPQKLWMLDLTREEQKKIYDYLLSLGFEENITIKAITKSDKFSQKLAILILNVDNRVYFGDEEVGALNRGEEKPRPKGKLGHLNFYNSGHERQQKEQIEQLRNSFENSYGGYLELDPKDLLDLIDNDLNEDLKYWGVKDDKMGPIKEDDFDWAEGNSYNGVKFKTIDNPTPTYTIEDTNDGDIIKVVDQDGKMVNYITKWYVGQQFESGKWYLLPIGESINESDDFGGGEDEITSLKGHRDHDDWVFIHRNLHRPPYYSIKSGRSGGPVIGYDTDIWLEDVTFKVQPGGRERTRKEMRRNVHAGVIGKIKDSGGNYDTSGWTLVTYNPYKNESFVEYETGEPIHTAEEVVLKNEKEVWVKKILKESDFDWIDDRPQPFEGEIELKIYLDLGGPMMSVEHRILFKNIEQFLSDAKDYVIEAVEGHELPLLKISINGWGTLNRYPSETQELKDGMAKIKKMAERLL